MKWMPSERGLQISLVICAVILFVRFMMGR